VKEEWVPEDANFADFLTGAPAPDEVWSHGFDASSSSLAAAVLSRIPFSASASAMCFDFFDFLDDVEAFVCDDGIDEGAREIEKPSFLIDNSSSADAADTMGSLLSVFFEADSRGLNLALDILPENVTSSSATTKSDENG
jgi:hypothetical protein